MANMQGLSAAQLLAIPADEPERLFKRDPQEIKNQFRRLAAQWHPDRATDPAATGVFQHLQALRDRAEQNLAKGIWNTPNLLELKATDGRQFNFRYLAKRPFELGSMYVGTSHLLYSIGRENADLAENAARKISTLPFANKDMEKEMRRFLPEVKSQFQTADQSILVMPKNPELVCMADLIAHCGGKVDSKHVAWIMSSLYNTACYLNFAKIAHHDFSPSSIFVAPQQHTTALLGGWWYAAQMGSPLQAMPARTVDLTPDEILKSKKADGRVDLELIRATGRELLGDPNGSRLLGSKEVPQALADWLRLPTSGDALTDYRAFKDEVLPRSFGKRRYVEWNLAPSAIYQPRS